MVDMDPDAVQHILSAYLACKTIPLHDPLPDILGHPLSLQRRKLLHRQRPGRQPVFLIQQFIKRPVNFDIDDRYVIFVLYIINLPVPGLMPDPLENKFPSIIARPLVLPGPMRPQLLERQTRDLILASGPPGAYFLIAVLPEIRPPVFPDKLVAYVHTDIRLFLPGKIEPDHAAWICSLERIVRHPDQETPAAYGKNSQNAEQWAKRGIKQQRHHGHLIPHAAGHLLSEHISMLFAVRILKR